MKYTKVTKDGVSKKVQNNVLNDYLQIGWKIEKKEPKPTKPTK